MENYELMQLMGITWMQDRFFQMTMMTTRTAHALPRNPEDGAGHPRLALRDGAANTGAFKGSGIGRVLSLWKGYDGHVGGGYGEEYGPKHTCLMLGNKPNKLETGFSLQLPG